MSMNENEKKTFMHKFYMSHGKCYEYAMKIQQVKLRTCLMANNKKVNLLLKNQTIQNLCKMHGIRLLENQNWTIFVSSLRGYYDKFTPVKD